jgi:hypothetical protein
MPHVQARTTTLLTFLTKKVLGSCGVRDLVENPGKFGDSGGRVDQDERKVAVVV